MEATLPISAAAKTTVRRDRKVVAAVPSISLPLRFMLTGLAALAVGIVWLVAQPNLLTFYHYSPGIIAVTHLFVLGFICTVVMGAMYQLVPVALETKLFSERLARWQFGIHVVGFIGMVCMFDVWNMKQVGHFGSVMALGVGLFVYNMVRTLWRVPKWSVVATAITAALFWFSLTVFVGVCLATAKCAYGSSAGLATAGGVKQLVGGLRVVANVVGRFDPIGAMHAHAHLGVVGFFVMLIVGVSYRLVPMFTLSELQSKRRALLSVVLLNVGLGGLVVTILLRNPWKLAFALLVVAGLAVYGWELCAILRRRQRRALDWGLKTFLCAVALLAPLSVMAVVLSWPGLPFNLFLSRLENVYGLLGLLGVVALAILGMLHKILPFLVWFGVYSPQVGRALLPTTAQMVSERLQAAGLVFYLAGLLTIVAGILGGSELCARIGCFGLLLSVGLFFWNAAKVLRHYFRPQLQPLPGLKPVTL
jgi:hypothetical protein